MVRIHVLDALHAEISENSNNVPANENPKKKVVPRPVTFHFQFSPSVVLCEFTLGRVMSQIAMCCSKAESIVQAQRKQWEMNLRNEIQFLYAMHNPKRWRAV